MRRRQVLHHFQQQRQILRARQQPPVIVDPAPWWKSMLTGLRAGTPVADLSAALHGDMAQAVAQTCFSLKSRLHLDSVGPTGGVFQNALLFKLANELLISHHLAPPNDGELALG